MVISKTKTSFYRRLYVAWLIDSGQAGTVAELVALTGMPRRTAQDTLAALADLDILCHFEQQPGERHNSGRYRVLDWGAIDKQWIARHLATIKSTLGYP